MGTPLQPRPPVNAESLQRLQQQDQCRRRPSSAALPPAAGDGGSAVSAAGAVADSKVSNASRRSQGPRVTPEDIRALLWQRVSEVRRCLRSSDAERKGVLPLPVLEKELSTALDMPPWCSAALRQFLQSADPSGSDEVEFARLFRVLRGCPARDGRINRRPPVPSRPRRAESEEAQPPSLPAVTVEEHSAVSSAVDNRRRLLGIDCGDRRLTRRLGDRRGWLGKRLRELDRPPNILGEMAAEVPWAVLGDSEQSDNVLRGVMKERREAIHAAVRNADAGDGRIPREALKKAVRSVDRYVGDDEITDMLSDLDPFRKGWVSTASFLARYESYLLESRATRASPCFQNVLHWRNVSGQRGAKARAASARRRQIVLRAQAPPKRPVTARRCAAAQKRDEAAFAAAEAP
eukprot:TRINITY_DN9925_c0_g1_i1.p1 TRINITY_DN9925_c0_g1~~TRINITY_DN9925_c0_g1_i1.p1  ORF type:complete len:405 (+),score=95.21 TRINITY_DN9925_c0_g1_i1:46-1260(+)